MLIKLNTLGQVEWRTRYGGHEIESCYDLCITNDNGFLVVGSTKSFGAGTEWKSYAVKTDSMGYVDWSYYNGRGEDNLVTTCCLNSHGQYILAGEFERSTEPYNLCLICLDDPSSIAEESLSVALPACLSQASPNPFNPTTTIRFTLPEQQYVSLSILDVQGRKIENLIDSNRPAGTHEINWDASGLPSGIYLYRLQAGNYTSVEKLVLVK